MHSAVAPQSMSTAPPAPVGTTGARAARRIPRIRLTSRVAADRMAPVLPAETNASAAPFFSRLRPTVREESFFSLKAVAGLSHISTTSEAWAISTPGGRSSTPSSLSTFRISSPRPTRTTSTPSSRTALSAPRTLETGALSPPMASTMIFMQLPSFVCLGPFRRRAFGGRPHPPSAGRFRARAVTASRRVVHPSAPGDNPR